MVVSAAVGRTTAPPEVDTASGNDSLSLSIPLHPPKILAPLSPLLLLFPPCQILVKLFDGRNGNTSSKAAANARRKGASSKAKTKVDAGKGNSGTISSALRNHAGGPLLGRGPGGWGIGTGIGSGIGSGKEVAGGGVGAGGVGVSIGGGAANSVAAAAAKAEEKRRWDSTDRRSCSHGECLCSGMLTTGKPFARMTT